MSQRIPNGTLLTTYDDLIELVLWAMTAVVIDHAGWPWIVFQTEDGDDCAVTAACPDDDIPGRTDFDSLCERGPLRVAFNGDFGPKAWPGTNTDQEETA
ncbi:hypothetical protein [Kribbella sp. VKM Ac-2566]|uniref:hypothetical protein n=1 Tax=Kribbella sp. VKM Ac-2566 TaxID=2512218 RepID=UPI001063CD9C|nr:hypothetical protein [Kribbella sp. VKM Ac-2566]TDW91112.1 hypothetical protein EV647_4682 [Kribbella sp. VKM Ac-2566]